MKKFTSILLAIAVAATSAFGHKAAAPFEAARELKANALAVEALFSAQVKNPPLGGPASIIVAASDSSPVWKAAANIRLSGTLSSSTDAARINAAIVAASARGGIVFLADGTYNLETSLVLDRSSITLMGESKPFWDSFIGSAPAGSIGNRGTKLVCINTGYPAIQFKNLIADGTDNRHKAIKLQNLYIVGVPSGTGYNSATGIDGTASGGADSCEIENVMVHRFTVGADLDFDAISLKSLNFQDNGGDALRVSSLHINVEDYICFDNLGIGFRTRSGITTYGLTMTGCRFGRNGTSSGGTNILLHRVRNVGISSTEIGPCSSGTDGIRLDSDAAGNSYNISIGGGVSVETDGGTAVKVGVTYPVTGVALSGITCRTTASTTAYAIDWRNGSTGAMTGNTAIGSWRSGNARTMNWVAGQVTWAGNYGDNGVDSLPTITSATVVDIWNASSIRPTKANGDTASALVGLINGNTMAVTGAPKYYEKLAGGYPTLDFDGTNDYLSCNLGTTAQPGWQIVLYYQDTDGVTMTPFGMLGGGVSGYIAGGTQNAFAGSAASGPAAAKLSWHCARITWSGAATKIKVDALTESTVNAGTAATGGGSNIGSNGSNGEKFDGKIRLVVYGTGTLSAADDLLLRQAMAASVGVTVNGLGEDIWGLVIVCIAAGNIRRRVIKAKNNRAYSI